MDEQIIKELSRQFDDLKESAISFNKTIDEYIDRNVINLRNEGTMCLFHHACKEYELDSIDTKLVYNKNIIVRLMLLYKRYIIERKRREFYSNYLKYNELIKIILNN